MKVPTGGLAPERWWDGLRSDEFIPLWDVLGGPRRHNRVTLRWEVERIAPLPLTLTSPDAWRSPEEPGRVRVSTRWPAIRAEILQRATIENMEICATGENEKRCYEEECECVGCAIPMLINRAHLVAAAFQDLHDVDFLVRIELDKDEFTTVKEAYGMLQPPYWIFKVMEDLAVLERVIFFTYAKHDIRLQPRYISTKNNLLADLLSRLDMPRFLVEHRAFLRATVWRQDRDDWMVCPVRWEELDQEFGPFTVDACVAESRANAYRYLSWSRVEDARVQKYDGHNTWGNLPFSIIAAIVKNFLKCKQRQQWGTTACFLVPVWAGNEAWELVKNLPGVFKVESLWAAILVSFFVLFRKDNLAYKTKGKT
ncbi:hypothetical protein CYMTET_27883, partial [Cymbomonas tetramitiformis]